MPIRAIRGHAQPCRRFPDEGKWDNTKLTMMKTIQATCALEVSTDLQWWSPLATIVNTIGETVVKDPAAVGANTRFYRAGKLPE